MILSACLEWLFAERTENFEDRILQARAAGLDAVEFWRSSTKDINAIKCALDMTGLSLTSFLAEPTVDLGTAQNNDRFLLGLQKSIQIAEFLGARILIVQTGNTIPGQSEDAQRKSIIASLREANKLIENGSLRLAIEPLNTLIDHKGCYLDSTTKALNIIDEVRSSRVGLVYDIYHSAVMGERTETVLATSVDRIFHVHIADMPGRMEPGSGCIDFQSRLGWLIQHGYSGALGLEYRPSRDTFETIKSTKSLLSQISP